MVPFSSPAHMSRAEQCQPSGTTMHGLLHVRCSGFSFIKAVHMQPYLLAASTSRLLSASAAMAF